MKKELRKKLDFYLKWGTSGLKVSLLILAVLVVFSVLGSLQIYPSNKLFSMLLAAPKTSVDFLAMFGGIILFIALPFTIGVRVGMSSKK